jgi:cellobiose-specific phosphotransferase system component IIB
MDDAVRTELLKQFKEWMLEQKSDEYTLRFYRDNYDHVAVSTDYAEGTVAFYPLEKFNVVEMSVINKITSNAVFYLHFELKDLEHGKELFEDMVEAVLKQKSSKVTKVLLCCSSGITTHYFLEKLKSASDLLNLNFEFSAVSYNNLYVKGYDNDVILLAPQISFELKKVQAVFRDQLVLAIPAQIFASYNAGELIDLVRAERHKKKTTAEEKAVYKVMRDIENNAVIFVVTVTHDINSTRICHRLYEKGNIVISQEVIKETNSLEDLCDILDTQMYALNRTYHIDAVCISLPGTMQNGEIRNHRISYDGLSEEFSALYHLPVFFCHNSAAVAYGYYAGQEKYDIVAYHSQPAGSIGAGQGYVYRGMPIEGRNQLGGEVGNMYEKMVKPQTDITCLSIEQLKDSVVFYLLAAVSVIAPEVILVRSAFTPDMEELKTELRKYVREEQMPDLISVTDVSEYAYLGTMLYGLRAYKERVRKQITK